MGFLDDATVVNGQLVKNISEAKLDRSIARTQARIIRINNRIQELKDKRTELLAEFNLANQLKDELNTQ